MKLLSNYLLIFILSTSTLISSAQSSNQARKKIHVIPVSVVPEDSFLESQIMKNALRTIYASGQYEVIVGDDQDYRKLIFGLQTLRIQVNRDQNIHDVTVILREQKSGKLVKKYIGSRLEKKAVLPKVEEFLSRLFISERPEKAPLLIIDKRKKLIKYPRPKSTNINLADNENKIETNVKVLSNEEKEEKRIRIAEAKEQAQQPRPKEKIWDEGKKPAEKRIVFLTNEQEPPPEPEEPEVAPPPKKPRVATPVVVVKKDPPPVPEPEPKPKKPRKPIYFDVGVIFDYDQMVTDDILLDVKTGILRYGLKFGADLWKSSWGGDIELSGSLINYSNKVIFRNLQSRLPIEWGFRFNYAQRLPFGLELKAGVESSQRSFANLREPFNLEGIQTGTLSTNDIFLDASIRFDFYQKTHRVGFFFSNPISQELDYGSSTDYETSGGKMALYYDYIMGKKKNSFIRAKFEQRELTVDNLSGFNYESTVFGVHYVINMGI